jgi:hypothetical protein
LTDAALHNDLLNTLKCSLGGVLFWILDFGFWIEERRTISATGFGADDASKFPIARFFNPKSKIQNPEFPVSSCAC